MSLSSFQDELLCYFFCRSRGQDELFSATELQKTRDECVSEKESEGERQQIVDLFVCISLPASLLVLLLLLLECVPRESPEPEQCGKDLPFFQRKMQKRGK